MGYNGNWTHHRRAQMKTMAYALLAVSALLSASALAKDKDDVI